MPFLPSLAARANLIDVFKAFPETSKPLIELNEALLRGPSPFTEAERELIAAYVSGLNGCRYCHGVHTATAERLGVPPGAIRRLLGSPGSPELPAKMKPILRYAEKLTYSPNGVTQADAEAVFAAGWNEAALYYTVAVTALFNFMNRLVEGLGIALDPAYVGPAAERLADHGYLPLIQMLNRSAKN